jgi:hypothetical protein
LFWEHEKQRITNQRTEGNIKRAFSLAQGKVGLFCGHVVGFDGGEHGKPDPLGVIVSKPSPDTLTLPPPATVLQPSLAGLQ